MVFSACTKTSKLFMHQDPRTFICPNNVNFMLSDRFFMVDICRCSYEDILLEMDRILRPEGAVIIRDNEKEVLKVKRIVSGMRWNTKMVDHEDGPLVSEKILFAFKQYWVAGNSTYSR